MDKGIEIMDIMVEKYPRNANLYKRRSFQYYFIGEFEKALVDINKAIDIRQEAEFFFTRALIFEGLREYEKAILDYNEAVNQAPDWFQARINRAVCFQTQNDIVNALNDINEALRIKPEAIEAYNLRGDLLVRQEEYEKAINDYEYIINHYNDKKDKKILKECKNKIKDIKKILKK